MKRLKGIALAVLFGIVFHKPLHADDILYQVGPLTLKVPFKTVNVVALYDAIGKRPLAGAETPLVTLWKITGDLGAVTTVEAQGAPYVGGHLELGTIVDKWLSLGDIHFGGFGGYDWNRGSAIAGIKATIPLW